MSSTCLEGLTCSAGAKVLITGGYLVLDRASSGGLVLSLNTRFYSSIFSLSLPYGGAGKDDETPLQEGGQSSFSDAPTVLRVVNDPASIQKLLASTDGHNVAVASSHTPSITSEGFVIHVNTPQRTKVPLQFQLEIPPLASISEDGAKPRMNTIFLSLTQTAGPRGNLFVHYSLLFTLSVVRELCLRRHQQADDQAFVKKLGCGLLIHLEGDYQFYTSTPPPASDRAGAHTIFTTKTGLGSSAALVSSLVSSIFAHFDLLNDGHARRIATHTAQFCHCLAQGKVGSGFDVSAAFWGSQRYIRFHEDCISTLLEKITNAFKQADANRSAGLIVDAATQKMLFACMTETSEGEEEKEGEGNAGGKQPLRWNYDILPFALPAQFRLVLGDVKGGSETPSMVRQVLAWRTNNKKRTREEMEAFLSPAELKAEKEREDDGNAQSSLLHLLDASSIWDELKVVNVSIEQAFAALRKAEALHSSDYALAMEMCSTTTASQWADMEAHSAAYRHICVSPSDIALDIVRSVATLSIRFRRARSLLRLMGMQAGVDIEPAVVGAFLDQTLEATPGVVMGGVPGAGGYDAIFAIAVNKKAEHNVKEYWRRCSAVVVAAAEAEVPAAAPDSHALTSSSSAAIDTSTPCISSFSSSSSHSSSVASPSLYVTSMATLGTITPLEVTVEKGVEENVEGRASSEEENRSEKDNDSIPVGGIKVGKSLCILLK